ncbi:hypothetical protein [Alteraurantiacibacter buctensis]|uniref:Uncharacterized protein n=1 Tax=Alteraurantiacibacter buctensis TaxID=1503981 RepID=A0A844Z2D1_9SPHN|nr:hypothetical protein [Alteraurantiacibacter buctensis]MXO73386.1 hypothetical protein [Alteraurantiacibacter buctensis]
MDQVQKMLQFVSTCGDPKKLRQIAKNADERNVPELAQAARLKLYSILPGEQPGTIEYAVWQSIFALEDVLKQERGKTILLSRTRQKIGRQGVTQCVADLVQGPASEGFRMLQEREMLHLSFEAIALQFPEKFDAPVLAAASSRLKDVGYSVG